IIGETPASLQGGLGYAIVNFNQYYSTQPANLWATIVACALLGIAFFLAVVLLERLVLKRAPENIACKWGPSHERGLAQVGDEAMQRRRGRAGRVRARRRPGRVRPA